MTNLVSLFDEVKRTFFPRWDNASEWQVRRKNRLSEGYNGRAKCNRETKTIEISRYYIAKDDNELRFLLSHEICHAVADSSHGLKWQRRFLKVADLATDLGQEALADKIHQDIENIKNSVTVTQPVIYQNINDALMDRPDASFEDVIEWVANNWGLTGDGLLKRYKNLKKFFDKTKREAISERNFLRKYD